MSQTPSSVYDALIIGGGISGLTLAWRLHQAGCRVLLLESASRVGGVIQTERRQGFQMEAGPNTFLKSASAIRALASSLNLKLLGASPEAKHRYIYKNQRLTPLPSSLGAFLGSPLLSAAGKLRLFSEPLRPSLRGAGDSADESVASLIRRRLGDEALDNVINPFLCGVYAGDPELLSVNAVFPKLAQWERERGGFLNGMLADRFSKRSPKPRRDPKELPEPALYSFADGMAALPNALRDALPPGATLTGAAALSIDWTGDAAQRRYRVTLADGRALEARAVGLATPADVAARLLGGLLPDAQREFLATIPYAQVSVAQIGVARDEIPHPLDGFGFLVPRAEGMRTLGAIWASALFADRAPQGYALFSAFIGGMCEPELNDWDDATLASAALSDVSTAFQCPRRLKPLVESFTRWRRAIPQALVGHPGRVAAFDRALQSVPGVFVTGNYLRGVSVNDCVADADRVAQRASDFLRQSGS